MVSCDCTCTTQPKTSNFHQTLPVLFYPCSLVFKNQDELMKDTVGNFQGNSQQVSRRGEGRWRIRREPSWVPGIGVNKTEERCLQIGLFTFVITAETVNMVTTFVVLSPSYSVNILLWLSLGVFWCRILATGTYLPFPAQLFSLLRRLWGKNVNMQYWN